MGNDKFRIQKDEATISKGGLSNDALKKLQDLKLSMKKPEKLTADERETEKLKAVLGRVSMGKSAFYLPPFDLGVVKNFVACRFKGDLFTLKNKFTDFNFQFLANTSVMSLPILFVHHNLLIKINLDHKYKGSTRAPRKGEDMTKYKRNLYAPTIDYSRWMELSHNTYFDVHGEWENLAMNRYRPISFESARICKGYWLLPLMPRRWVEEADFNITHWEFITHDFLR